MRATFQVEFENGAIISDEFNFRNKVGKGILNDVFNNWKELISNSYHVDIRNATYFEN
jgi:hypothetical protein